MELRMIGHSGLKVSPLCLGGNVFNWTIDEKRSMELLDARQANRAPAAAIAR
jgi:aryl-alcohol dehydrogenase-like predicted oxidoreductase